MNEALRTLMKKHGLTETTVRKLLDVSKFTVRAWLAKPERLYFRKMPLAQYDRLEELCQK